MVESQCPALVKKLMQIHCVLRHSGESLRVAIPVFHVKRDRQLWPPSHPRVMPALFFFQCCQSREAFRMLLKAIIWVLWRSCLKRRWTLMLWTMWVEVTSLTGDSSADGLGVRRSTEIIVIEGTRLAEMCGYAVGVKAKGGIKQQSRLPVFSLGEWSKCTGSYVHPFKVCR